MAKTGKQLKQLRIDAGITFEDFCTAAVMEGAQIRNCEEEVDYGVSDIFEELYLYTLGKMQQERAKQGEGDQTNANQK